jgi:hypothetical protein
MVRESYGNMEVMHNEGDQSEGPEIGGGKGKGQQGRRHGGGEC